MQGIRYFLASVCNVLFTIHSVWETELRTIEDRHTIPHNTVSETRRMTFDDWAGQQFFYEIYRMF